MVKYTWEDIIINPNDPRLENAIGKECYFSDYPNYIITQINEDNCSLSKLEEIEISYKYPFLNTEGRSYECIIIKKEEPKEYIPFDTIEEFIKASLEHNKNHVLSSTGIWLEEKTFDKNGELEDYYIYNIDSFDMINNIVFSGETNFNFSQLLKSKATFLDGTPCGKLKE